MLNKTKLVASVFITLMLSSAASHACIMMGMSGQGGNCARDCELYGKPYWLCMLGAPAPQQNTSKTK